MRGDEPAALNDTLGAIGSCPHATWMNRLGIVTLTLPACQTNEMSIERYREIASLSEIISHAVWLYYRFGISLRDVEDLLAERESPCPTKRFADGVQSSGSTMPSACGDDKVDSEIRGSWTKCSSRSTASSSRGATVGQRSASFASS